MQVFTGPPVPTMHLATLTSDATPNTNVRSSLQSSQNNHNFESSSGNDTSPCSESSSGTENSPSSVNNTEHSPRLSPSTTHPGLEIGSNWSVSADSAISGKTSAAETEPLECQWVHCEAAFHSMETLVNHVNDVHVKVEREVEYKCYWRDCPRRGKGFNARSQTFRVYFLWLFYSTLRMYTYVQAGTTFSAYGHKSSILS